MNDEKNDKLKKGTFPLKLQPSFYAREDVVQVSRELLGKVLCTRIDGLVSKAVITETEAYAGVGDRASHAYGGRRTKRTEPMFGAGGQAYVYLCYGIHHLFNVVTAKRDTPHAVLVRAGQPLAGIASMETRRNKRATDRTFMAGPGTFAQAMGITRTLTGSDLTGEQIWIEDHGHVVQEDQVSIGPRIGIAYAAEDAERPYRFVLNPSPALSGTD